MNDCVGFGGVDGIGLADKSNSSIAASKGSGGLDSAQRDGMAPKGPDIGGGSSIVGGTKDGARGRWVGALGGADIMMDVSGLERRQGARTGGDQRAVQARTQSERDIESPEQFKARCARKTTLSVPRQYSGYSITLEAR
jgi:hypothetical protein